MESSLKLLSTLTNLTKKRNKIISSPVDIIYTKKTIISYHVSSQFNSKPARRVNFEDVSLPIL